MKWAILSSLVLSLALPVISSPVPTGLIPYKKYAGEDHYSKTEVQGANVEIVSSLEERHSALDLAYFPLAIHLPPNSVMFQVKSYTWRGRKVTGFSKATCVESFTTGNAIVTTTEVETDDSILGDFLHFLTNPTEIIVDALDLNLRLGFQGVTGHFEIYIKFAIAGTYIVPIFTSESLLSIQLNDKDSIGLIFEIELAFKVTGPVNVIAGFEVEIPDDTFIILNSLSGELVEENLKGIKAKATPAKFKSGAGCFNVALRFKLKAGTPVEVFNFGFKFEAGTYIDAPLHKACITYQIDQPYTLNFTENFIIDVAVYADVAKAIDIATWAAGPTVVSTLYIAPLPSTCFVSTTSTAQRTLASSTISNHITLTPELETTSRKSTQEMPSTTIRTYSSNATTSSSSSAATNTPSGIISVPATVPFSNSTRVFISHTRLVQTYGSETDSFPAGVIKIPSSSDYTTKSETPLPIATTDNTFIVPTQSEEHDDSASILNDLPKVTVNSKSTYTIYSCAKEAIWCPSTMLFPQILTKTVAENTAISSSSSTLLRVSAIHTVSDQPSPTSITLLPPTSLPAIEPPQITNSHSALGTDTPTHQHHRRCNFHRLPHPYHRTNRNHHHLFNNRRTRTGTIEADLSCDKIRRQLLGKIPETASAAGRRRTTSSTKTTVPSISRGSK
ncbi:uncharacterized protein Bfra_012126 [Botrytis fragariae]|uniref:Uncharacterized protein n=1 Tax=Botrytis fragariae TaxID=1964551 RepID=A0A8H6AJW2_9HELO|nr:uncharacterized protein Bfra_012126 [Botrytis fragariae]KAF5868794.1 hypothetical protein Bfra_012126 [Botrytis fragariae]